MSTLTKRRGLAAVAVASCAVGSIAVAAPAGAATAPSAVGGLSIAGKTTSTSAASLTFSWAKSGAKDLKGYTVVRNSSDKTAGATVLTASTTATSYADKTVKPGKTYWYFVAAINKSKQKSEYTGVPVVVASSTRTTAIAGIITDVAGTGLDSVSVSLARGSNNNATYDNTDDGGFFSDTSLPAASTGYSLCYATYSGTEKGVGALTGYVSECYNNQPFYAQGKYATRLLLGAGQFRGVRADMATGGAISGHVTLPKGFDASDADATLYDGDGDYVNDVTTDDEGNYTLTGIRPGKLYSVYISSVEQGDGDSGPSTAGTWVGGSTAYQAGNPFPSNVTSFTVTGGKIVKAASVTPALAGTISGTIGGGSDDTTVYLIDGAGNRQSDYIGTAEGQSDNTYTFTTLAPGAYTLCARSNDYDDNGNSVYAAQCVTGVSGGTPTTVAWDGDRDNLPAAAKGKVTVTSNTTTSLSFDLPPVTTTG